MGKLYESLSPEHQAFIRRQPLYFVASAPLAADGHVNVSPKGLDTFRILDARTVAYLDLTGSGNETAAHLQENGRLTLMFCAFEDNPKILRLYCRARVVTRRSLEWDEWLARFPAFPGTRQIVVADVMQVQSSCGFGVPLMETVAQRALLPDWADRKGPEALVEYRQTRNAVSLDGLVPPATD